MDVTTAGPESCAPADVENARNDATKSINNGVMAKLNCV